MNSTAINRMSVHSNVVASWMTPGTPCWAEIGLEQASTPTMFLRCSIVEVISSASVLVLLSGQQVPQRIESSKIHRMNSFSSEYDRVGIPDMVSMDELNEAEIISNLRVRYEVNQISTFIGPTLIVMNPYKKIPVTSTHSRLLAMIGEESGVEYSSIVPETAAIAAQCFSRLFLTQKNQAIVISGESGAGKTENAKICLSFLTEAAKIAGESGNINNSRNEMKSSKVDSNIAEKILSCNPILEAFGNAKTMRNENSSRFGKFISLSIESKARTIVQANINSYLLEKSRVTCPSVGERNYHVFYSLLRGAQTKQLSNLFGCKDPESMLRKLNYTLRSDCFEANGVDDKSLFKEVNAAMQTMGFTNQEVEGIWKMLAAVLWIGNVEFDATSATEVDPVRLADSNSIEAANRIAELLDVDVSEFVACVTSIKRKIGSSVIVSPRKFEDVIVTRDSTARSVYDRLFVWIVARLNAAINSSGVVKGNSKSIGLLDIFGFEVFQVNSFEQLCINYTNEKLQQLYVQYVFKAEETAFASEGLLEFAKAISYTDNRELIDMLEKPPLGIFQLIDEASALASSSDLKLFDSISKMYGSHSLFKAVQKTGNRKVFAISHTAKQVEYDIEGFRDKNKAEISQDLLLLLAKSSNGYISDIFFGLLESKSQQEKIVLASQQTNSASSSKENKFLGCKFRAQMRSLMDELISADCHFIRCIKPNELKVPSVFLEGYVLIQIKYLGVLQAIQARKQGYPYRKEFANFFNQYKEIVPKFRYQQPSSTNLKIECQEIIEFLSSFKVGEQKGLKLNLSEVLFGKSKLFAKDNEGRQLDLILQQWIQVKKGFIQQIISAYRLYRKRITIFSQLKALSRAYKSFIRIVAIAKMIKQRKRFQKIKQTIGYLSRLSRRILLSSAFLNWKQKPKPKPKPVSPPKIKPTIENIEEHRVLQPIFENQQTQQSKQQFQTLEKQHHQSETLSSSSGQSSMIFQSVNMSMYSSTTHAMNMASEINEHMRDRLLNESMIMDNNQQSPQRPKMLGELKDGKSQLIESQYLNSEAESQNSDSSKGNQPKRKSQFEKYLCQQPNPSLLKCTQKVESDDRFLDFASSNQDIIRKIQENKFFEMCSTIFASRKKNFNEVYTLSERASYQIKPLTKPLTSIPKHNEPTAVKSFLYLLKYSGDKSRHEVDRREISCKLVKLILQQDDQEVSDEIFLQIVKQLTNNNTASIDKYFELAGLVASVVTLSTRIAFGVMNFFYEQALFYQEIEQSYYEQWCKYIMLRVGNNLVFSDRNSWDSLSFRRNNMPLKEEFSAIQKMRNIPQTVFLYGETSKVYRIESYTKVCNLIGMVAIDLSIGSDNEANWYGLVEYVFIDKVVTTTILDFSERVMDWKARRTKAKNEYLAQNKYPGASYEFKLYFQTVILHSVTAGNIDTTLMLYATFANEFLHGIYYLDIKQKENCNITELDCVVSLAAAKVMADQKKQSTNQRKNDQVIIDLPSCVPSQFIGLIPGSLWIEKINKEIVKLHGCTPREARTVFLNRMKMIQGRYFLTQKYFCTYSCSTNSNANNYNQGRGDSSTHGGFSEKDGQVRKVVVLTKFGFVYIIALDNQEELQEIPFWEISHFAIDFNVNATKLIIHTKRNVIILMTPTALNLYYNIDYYITEVSKLENASSFNHGQWNSPVKQNSHAYGLEGEREYNGDDSQNQIGYKPPKRMDYTAEKLIENTQDSDSGQDRSNRKLFFQDQNNNNNNNNQLHDQSIHLYDSLL